MTCKLGRLYNKETIVQTLLRRKKVVCEEVKNEHLIDSTIIDHIRVLKDTKELKLINYPAYDRNKSNISAGDGSYVDRHNSAFMSIIARLQMKDSYPFLCDWITGNVISERGHKGIKNDPTYAIDEDNIVFLNPEQKKFTECAKCN